MPEKILFADFIEEQSVPFTVYIKTPGGYVDGEWVPGATGPVEKRGVILPLSNDILNFAEAGTYTTKERKLMTVFPLEEGTKCEYKGNVYTVEAIKDLVDYTDVHIYVMRWREK